MAASTEQRIQKQIRQEARRLLESGEVELVIGFEQGTLPLRSAPAFIRDATDTDRLIWGPFCENNLARYLVGLKGRKVAIVAKGCDTRAIVALMIEHQVEREQVLIIGVPCRGMVDRRVVARRVPGEVLTARWTDTTITVEGEDFTKRLRRKDVLYPSCAACTYPNPVIHDFLVGEPVTVWSDDECVRIATFEEKSPAERWAYFEAETSRCIRCYACREACPLCYCEECFVDHTTPRWIESGVTPAGLQGWHIGRAYHLAGRCVNCGACQRACPMEIDLVYLTGKLNKDVRELYGFEPGLSLEELPPLATFRPEDA
jgi:formate dehydrogenase subunit beta